MKTKTAPPTVGTPVRGGFHVSSKFKAGLQSVALLGLILNTLGLVIALRLPVRLWQSLAAFFSLNFEAAATRPTPFDDLKSPTPLFPLLALILWLVSAFVLLSLKSDSLLPFIKKMDMGKTFGRVQPAPTNEHPPSRPAIKSFHPSSLLPPPFLLAFVLLGTALLLGWAQRATQLLPDGAGRFPQPSYDEMVYYAGSALFAGGHPPYRDFFTAHPPGVYLVFAGLFKLFGLESGGLNTFLIGRWFSLIQGLLTVAAVFWTAGRLWTIKSEKFAIGAAFVAALLYALDGRAAEIAVLENLSNLCAVVAFGCFLESERATPGKKRWWLVATGGLATAAALSKLPGLALLFALVVYLIYRREWRNFSFLRLGFYLGILLIEGPFVLIAGPGEVLRQQFFFQVLRPQEVRAGLDEIARIAEYPEAALTVFLGGLGLCFLSWRILRQPDSAASRLLIPVLWTAPLLIIFIFSKSYHNWYYVQWALPLALLAGGVWAGRGWTFYRMGLLSLLALIALPLLLNEWQDEHRVDYDRVYVPSAQYVSNKVCGKDLCPQSSGTEAAMLALDPGYPLIAGLSPARLPDGKYLIDGSGYLVYLNLDLDRLGLGQLFRQALGFDRDKAEAQAIFERGRAQTLVTAGTPPGGWVALDGKIALQGQIMPRSVEYIETASNPPTSVDYVRLYQVRNLPILRERRFDNGLFVMPFGLSTSFQGKANYDPLNKDGSLSLSAKDAASRILDLRLAWRVGTNQPQQLKVFVHLIDERGMVVAQRDLPPLGGNTDTRQWRQGDAFQDVQSLPLPSGLASGRYKVIMGLYVTDTGQRIPVEGQDNIVLGQLEIRNN